MIQRFPFRVFAAALLLAVARYYDYRLQSFGNLCDMN